MSRRTFPSARFAALAAGLCLAGGAVLLAVPDDKDKDAGWVPLIKGSSLAESGWTLRRKEEGNQKNGWTIKDGVLANKVPAGGHSIDIVTEKKWKDFDLHVEFKIPKGSNSGVYLRGVYEIQVEDTHGRKPEEHICGAIYGLKAPSENAALPAGEWQTFDLEVRGNKITVVHNKKKVIEAFEVTKVTGGALEKVNHGEPGPVMLQGDHGDVEYRNLKIRPAEGAKA
jgi:hypothetical protein